MYPQNVGSDMSIVVVAIVFSTYSDWQTFSEALLNLGRTVVYSVYDGAGYRIYTI